MRIVPLATLLLIASAGVGFAQTATPKGDPTMGEKRFRADGCWQCHGLAGQGAPSTGPRLSHTALEYDAFLHQLRAPASEMPPYEAVILPDAAAADIYSYIKSLPDAPDWKTIPLLNASVK